MLSTSLRYNSLKFCIVLEQYLNMALNAMGSLDIISQMFPFSGSILYFGEVGLSSLGVVGFIISPQILPFKF